LLIDAILGIHQSEILLQEQKVIQGKTVDTKELEKIINTASEYKPQVITEKLFLMLNKPEWSSRQDEIIGMLIEMIDKSDKPKLLNLLFKRHEYKVDQEKWGWVAFAISKEAEDRNILEDLLKLLHSTTDRELDLADEIYIAINSLSRRLNLHITADGLIEEEA